MAYQTKKSVMAIVPEVTEATPVAPSGATQYIALQDGFSLTPSFDSLDNAELSGSIGASKPVLGFSNPALAVDHYIRHSGVEGQAPDFGLLLEAGFGAKSTASTEYDTVSSSTTSVIKVNTGEGATFERGELLLIKDPTNGYNIRPILSISGDNLTLGFQVPVAPGTGINLGKCVLYKPGESHPTFTAWDYRANGGAVQMASGFRVTQIGVSATAGDFINGSFSAEGVSFYYNPITLAATDTKLDFTDDAGTFAATIAAGVYTDPHDLAAAIQLAMDDVTTTTPTVTYSDSTGKFTIKTTGTVLSLLWNTGGNAANTIGDKIGFSTAADDSGTAATTGYTSDNAQTITSPYTPSYDSSNPLVAKYNEVMIGDADDYACFSTQSIQFNLNNSKADIKALCAESGKSGSVITAREVTIDLVANLQAYEADKFHRFHSATELAFAYNFGTRTGSNWTAGKCGGIYLPKAVITSFELTDTDGLVTVNMSLKAYVESGLGEAYLGFV